MFTLGSFAIVFDDQHRILLCHRRDLDIWNLPGGAVEPGELPNLAAIRETLEETGLQIEVERLVGVYNKPDSQDLVFAFSARVIGGELTLTEESGALQFFALAEIPVNTIPRHLERIRDAARNLPAPIFRTLAGLSTREYLAQLKRG